MNLKFNVSVTYGEDECSNLSGTELVQLIACTIKLKKEKKKKTPLTF